MIPQSANIVLVGYRGSGKTTAGRLLAARLGRPFVDTDEVIVARAGLSIKEIFAQQGEPTFRDLETAALREAISRGNQVIGLGGGALGREENRQAIAQTASRIFYLRCDAEELYRRIQSDPQTTASRPNLTELGGGVAEIERLLEKREPIYRQMMHDELDVTSLSLAAVAEKLATMLFA